MAKKIEPFNPCKLKPDAATHAPRIKAMLDAAWNQPHTKRPPVHIVVDEAAETISREEVTSGEGAITESGRSSE